MSELSEQEWYPFSHSRNEAFTKASYAGRIIGQPDTGGQRMQPGLALTHFLAVFVATSTSLLLLAAAERRFDPLPAPREAASSLGTRCNSVSWLDEDSVAARWVPLPSRVCLTAAPVAGEVGGWFVAAPPRPSSRRAGRAPIVALGSWRPAGTDSVDVRLPGWPVGVRLRLPATDSTGIGRLTATGDAAVVIPFQGSLYALNWPSVYRVRVRRLALEP